MRAVARRGGAHRRRGNALVEFALIAVAFYLLLAGTVELGRMIFASQVLQSAARVGARELAVTPLPGTATFAEALAHHDVRARVYDPAKLVIVVDPQWTDADLRAEIDALPIVNRALAPLFQHDFASLPGQDLLRYPGALFDLGGSYHVLIPRVLTNSGGAQAIEWVEVVEEAVPDASDPTASPFSLVSTGPQRGLVALRINYPFQAAMLSAFKHEVDADGNVRNIPILADDASVAAPPSGYGSPEDGATVGAYAGVYGLGAHEALGQRVRPFRRLLTNQSFFRREVFSE